MPSLALLPQPTPAPALCPCGGADPRYPIPHLHGRTGCRYFSEHANGGALNAEQRAPVAHETREDPRPMTTTAPEMPAPAHDAETGEMPPEPTASPVTVDTTEPAPEFAATAPAAPSEALSMDPSDPRWSLALQPTSAREAMILATVVFKSQMFPVSKYRNRDMIFAVIEMGRERGISAMLALQAMHVIEGKVEMSADLMAALVLRSGKAKRFACVETTREQAVYEAQRHDDPTPMRVIFTKQDAIDRQLWGKGNWSKMPDVMLAHRACSKAARLKFPEVTVGIYGQGEIRESVPVDDDALLGAAAAKAGVQVPASPANGQRRSA